MDTLDETLRPQVEAVLEWYAETLCGGVAKPADTNRVIARLQTLFASQTAFASADVENHD
jgi:hypothetical protein